MWAAFGFDLDCAAVAQRPSEGWDGGLALRSGGSGALGASKSAPASVLHR